VACAPCHDVSNPAYTRDATGRFAIWFVVTVCAAADGSASPVVRQAEERSREPLLAIPLVLGILVAVGALFLRLNGLAFGEPIGPIPANRMSYLPMFAHFVLVLIAGIYLPAPVVTWFQNVAGMLG